MNIEEVKQEILKIYPDAFGFSTKDGIDGIICRVPCGNVWNFLTVGTKGKSTFTVDTRCDCKEGTDLAELLLNVSFPVGVPIDNMIEISITLPEVLVQYMDENSYVGNRSRFIASLIKRELEKSQRKIKRDKNEPRILREFCE